MNIITTLLLFITLILKNINGATSFDTQAFALAHPCVWSVCNGLPSEEQNYTVSCCILQVSMNYVQPNQSLISVYMLRLSPPDPNNNTLFVLNGGPGESGLGLVSVMSPLIPVDYGIIMIFPDHRGTGSSSPLGSDDQNSQVITLDCIKYLTNRWTVQGLNQFSTTSAAHDLAIQIQAAQLISRISILGVSYGTYWLNRFLTIYPNLVQAAVMDSPHRNFLVIVIIAFSELWLSLNQSEVDQQTLNAWQNATVIAPDLRPDLIALRQAWPKYALDEYRYRLANSSVLMIAGQLDAATSLDFSSHLASITGKTRTLYSIPLSGHIIELFVTATGYSCPLNLILSWTFPSVFPSE